MNEDGSCPIPGCSYICKSRKRSTFLMHIQSKHKRECGVAENTYQCPHCDKICMTRSILNNHLSEVHDKTPRAYLWKCLEPNCGAVHKTKASLASHHVSRHIGKKASACITDGGLCVICGENREGKTAASNVYHYAVCSGVIKAINDRSKEHKIIDTKNKKQKTPKRKNRKPQKKQNKTEKKEKTFKIFYKFSYFLVNKKIEYDFACIVLYVPNNFPALFPRLATRCVLNSATLDLPTWVMHRCYESAVSSTSSLLRWVTDDGVELVLLVYCVSVVCQDHVFRESPGSRRSLYQQQQQHKTSNQPFVMTTIRDQFAMQRAIGSFKLVVHGCQVESIGAGSRIEFRGFQDHICIRKFQVCYEKVGRRD